MTTLAIIDYGIGNLRSVQKAFEHVGAVAPLTEDPAEILAADKVVLPGVGAFGDGMKGIHARGLADVVAPSRAARRCSGSAWVCRSCSRSAKSSVNTRASAFCPDA
ncbi:MAG TPA: hypothetical protein PK954_22660 [Anaerolineales bacterium]|nr:hypothetical protein [Anaerolineales bacterium]